MQLSTLAKIVQGKLVGTDAEFARISTDSRAIRQGDCFIAIKGEFFDGHDFIADVAGKSASVVVVDRDVTAAVPVIRVNNTRKALMALACYYRDAAAIPVAAITGSCGKTTTRALLENILKQCGDVLASQKSFNNDIGLPLTLLQLKPDHDFAVLEIGTNHPGEIAALTAIAKPTIAVITMVAPVHVEGFGSVEKIAIEKGAIYAGLAPDGIAVINADDPFANYWKETVLNQNPDSANGSESASDRETPHIITFAQHHTADVTARDVRIMQNGESQFTLVFPAETIQITLPLLGEHNVVNALAAAATAFAMHIPIDVIKTGLETVQPEHARLNIKTTTSGATIIDDSYNANPASVKAAIDVLIHRSKNTILVLGDMKELGEGAEKIHADIGDYAFAHGVKKLFCYGEMSVNAATAFGKNAFHFADQQALIDALTPHLTEDATVLVKGSNSMKMNKIVNAISLAHSHAH